MASIERVVKCKCKNENPFSWRGITQFWRKTVMCMVYDQLTQYVDTQPLLG
jgi:hypothetical protein